MSYTDINMKFPDQAMQENAVPPETFLNMDVIGNPAKQDGTIDTTQWLLNIRLTDSESLTVDQQTYVIAAPVYPKRIWLGS